MRTASCNICNQRIKEANEDKIRKHYRTFHSCKPLQKCESCGQEKVLVELAENTDGDSVVIANCYCKDCLDDDYPFKELLVRKVGNHE